VCHDSHDPLDRRVRLFLLRRERLHLHVVPHARRARHGRGAQRHAALLLRQRVRLRRVRLPAELRLQRVTRAPAGSDPRTTPRRSLLHLLRSVSDRMPYVLGIVLALAVGAYATAMRLDRDRAFYPVLLIVFGSYYVLFAILSGSASAIVIESLITAGFALVASLGFRRSLWLVVAGLVAHGAMDLVHGQLVTNPGVPAWWPAWCMSYDVVAGAYLAWRLARTDMARTPRPSATFAEAGR